MAFEYKGRDLEAMSFARNYHNWIIQVIEPYLGSRIVEVGAGSGSFSELLMARQYESLTLVEPSGAMYQKLLENVRPNDRLHTYNSLFVDVADAISKKHSPDSIIYVNVMEHVEDDERELRAARQALMPGGRLVVFVPAFQWLYGEFDRTVGHFRRYTKSELEAKCVRAGFRPVLSRYFDLFGVFPWWVKYRLLKSAELEPAAVAAYDRVVVPVAQLLERAIRPPFGKNIIMIAENR